MINNNRKKYLNTVKGELRLDSLNSRKIVDEVAIRIVKENLEIEKKHGPCYRLILDKDGKVVDRILISKGGGDKGGGDR